MLDDFALNPELQATINKYLPYLLEIRKRLLFLACLFIIASIIGFFYYDRVIIFILKFLDLQGVNVAFTSPFQFFTLAVNSGLFLGLIAIFPFIVYQLLSFLKPALSPKEYRLISASLPISLILLAIGFVYGVLTMKFVVALFYQKSLELHISNILDIELLLSNIVITGLLMGLAFQFPIIFSILMHLKIITHKFLTQQRFIFYVVATVFVILLPPTDIMSDIILFTPLAILFESTLLLNRFLLRKEADHFA